MTTRDLIFPGILILAGIISLILIEQPYNSVCFALAVICSTIVYFYGKSRSSEIATEFKVSLKEISFIHYERSREDRPDTTEKVTKVFDLARQEMKNQNYADAASHFSQAFSLGNQYWAAKVNEGFCYQAAGNFEKALSIYGQIDKKCPTARFRRQALGNSGEVLFAMASATNDTKQARSLMARGYQKYSAAYQAEETFVSLYNLWQAATMAAQHEQAAQLLAKLQTHSEFEQLADEHKIPRIPRNTQGDRNGS